MRLPDFMKIFRSASKNRKTIAWSAGAAIVGIAVGSVVKPVPITINFGLSYLAKGFYGIDAGDWLQAGAGFFGIVFTIWATRKLERAREADLRREAFSALLASTHSINRLAHTFELTQKEGLNLSIEQMKDLIRTLAYLQPNFEVAKNNIRSSSIIIWHTIGPVDTALMRIREHLTTYPYIDESCDDTIKYKFIRDTYDAARFLETSTHRLIEELKTIDPRLT